MPVNYQQIREAIQRAGLQAPLRERELQDRRREAQRLLSQYAREGKQLNQRAERALELNPDLRTALAGEEALNEAIDPPAQVPALVIWAADGSQIIPDPHLALQFGVINVGLIRLTSGQTPRQQIESRLLFAEEIYTAQGYLVGEEIIALRRDFQERDQLLKAGLQEQDTVLTLTDGPLELFREGKESREYQMLLEQYLSVLSQMAERGLLTAGYVDKPRADLLVRLLELQLIPDDKLDEAGRLRPLLGVADTECFASILQPGQRSAIFKLQAKSAQRFSGQLAIHFFFLNVGREGKPQVARVEIPQWVAQDAQQVALVHHALITQCRQMGSKAYPYILHRAHETAVVSFAERDRLMEMLQIEMLNQGLSAGQLSNKQSNKNLAGRTRYGR